jgi:hypothetical protein
MELVSKGFLIITNTDALPYYTPIFSPASDNWKISDQYSVCYFEIHTDDRQQLRPCTRVCIQKFPDWVDNQI